MMSGGRGRGKESSSRLPAEHRTCRGAQVRSMRSWPEPKPRVGRLTIWATQALLCRSFLVWCSPTGSFLVLLPMLLVSNPKKHLLNQCQGAYHLFSFGSFMVSSIRSLLAWFLCDRGRVSSMHVTIQFSQHNLLKSLSSPHCIFLSLLS